MAFGKLARVAVEVGDAAAVAADLGAIFGMELEVRDVPEMGIRAAIGEDGLELVEKVEPEPKCAEFWAGPLAAICIAVDDLDEAERRMERAGVRLVQRVRTAGGMRELFYGTNFHGVPLVLYEHHEAGFRESVGDAEGGLAVEWLDSADAR